MSPVVRDVESQRFGNPGSRHLSLPRCMLRLSLIGKPTILSNRLGRISSYDGYKAHCKGLGDLHMLCVICCSCPVDSVLSIKYDPLEPNMLVSLP
jgi:hypothetical protein